jgi:hypothetical protein
MKPVYFPHTYLPDWAVASLRTLFPSVAVYQPVAGRLPQELRPLVENGFLEVVSPPAGDADDIDRLLRGFEEWGRRHHAGAGLEAARIWGAVFGETSGAEDSLYGIAAQLKRRIASEPDGQKTDSLLAARVFLQLAQEADQQQRQIAGELARYERSQAKLFDALRGRGTTAPTEATPPAANLRSHDVDDRVEARMAAWTRLFLKYPYDSPIFVTHSTVLVRYLEETLSGRRQASLRDLMGAAGEPSIDPQLFQKSVWPFVQDLAAGRIALPEPPAGGLKAPEADSPSQAIAVHVWPDISAIVFFRRLFPGAAPNGADQPSAQVAWRHTIVIQIGDFVKTTTMLDTPI